MGCDGRRRPGMIAGEDLDWNARSAQPLTRRPIAIERDHPLPGGPSAAVASSSMERSVPPWPRSAATWMTGIMEKRLRLGSGLGDIRKADHSIPQRAGDSGAHRL